MAKMALERLNEEFAELVAGCGPVAPDVRAASATDRAAPTELAGGVLVAWDAAESPVGAAADTAAPAKEKLPASPPDLKIIGTRNGEGFARKMYTTYISEENFKRWPAFLTALDQLLDDFGGKPEPVEEDEEEKGKAEDLEEDEDTASIVSDEDLAALFDKWAGGPDTVG